MSTTSRAAFPLLALLLAGACSRQSPAPPPGESTPPKEEAARMIRAEPGKPVQVKPGEQFEVVLASNMTTGYQWQLADSAMGGIVALVSSTYTPDPAPPGVAGSGGNERWVFRGAKPGEARVSMVYVRPWEQGAAPAESASFQVTVR